MCDLRFTQR